MKTLTKRILEYYDWYLIPRNFNFKIKVKISYNQIMDFIKLIEEFKACIFENENGEMLHTLYGDFGAYFIEYDKNKNLVTLEEIIIKREQI